LIISQYIPDSLKVQLKQYGINYLEASGNCYIYRDDLFILINDQQASKYRISKNGKIWNEAGLKFLFVILAEPTLLNKPYREIAKYADISASNIGIFLKELM